MPIKWIGFICVVWIIGILLGGTFDGQTSATNTWGPEGETSLEYISDIRKVTYVEGETGAFAWLTPNPEYFDAMFAMLSWDFGFLRCSGSDNNCGYAYFRYIVLIPFTIVALFGFIYMFVTLLQGFLR